MSADQVKPSYNAKRRIQLLFVFCLLLIAAATAAWYYIAGRIDGAARQAISQQQARQVDIQCDGRAVRGYPFRFGLFCDSFAIDNAADGYVVDAGALRSAAQFYAPRDLVVELDGPLTFERAGLEPFIFEWAQMRARVMASEPLPKNVSVVGQNFIAGREGFATHFTAEQVETHFRVVDADADFAGRALGFAFDNAGPNLANLLPLDADFDLRVNNGVQLLTNGVMDIRGAEGELKRLALLLNEDRGILISGPYSVAQNGLLNASLEVRIIDVDAVMAVAATAFPDVANLLSAFANGQPRTGDNKDEVTLQITISDGKARMGFIPLGTLPPL